MMKLYKITILVLLFCATLAFPQDFDGLKIYINPGHGGNDSNDRYIAATGFWESEGNLTKGLYLRDMLQNLNADVYMSRTQNRTEDDLPLSQIDADANANNVDYFHSIHSNAANANANYTLMLYKETNGSPADPESKRMGDIMANHIYKVNRTTGKYNRGDYSFLGFNLGVLRYLNYSIMHGTLSEGSFHDNVPESWRLQSLDYRKHESIAILRSLIDFYNLAKLPYGVIAGLIRNPDEYVSYGHNSAQSNDKYRPLNGATVTLFPGNRQYQVDQNNNGFYMFDSLAPGTYQVVVEAEGYPPDSGAVNVTANKSVFNDVFMVSDQPPVVTSTVPADGDSAFSVLDEIIIRFSRSMNTAAVESNLQISPSIPARMVWGNEDRELKIKSDSLKFETEYSISIDTLASDRYGHFLDGNADSTGSQPFAISFRTGMDNVEPRLIGFYPAIYAENVELQPVISLDFDEQLDSSSVLNDQFKLELHSDKSAVWGTLEHFVVNGRSVLNFFPDEKLVPGEIYVCRVSPGFADRFGNATTKYYSFSFVTGTSDWDIINIDPLEDGFTNDWWSPTGSGSTTGVSDVPPVYRAVDRQYVNLITGSTASMKLFYNWDMNANAWLIREYLSGGAPRNKTFDTSYTLQCYLFGDGSGNKFRFALDEGDGSSWSSHEVSKWFTIDWIGWKLVEWELNDAELTGSWAGLGNGKLDNSRYRIDSFQFTHEQGAAEQGTVYIDDLRLVKVVPATGIETEENFARPTQHMLAANYPNPFNPDTNIRFAIARTEHVKIEVFNELGQLVETLINGTFPAGEYRVVFSGKSLASGVYLCKMRAGKFVKTQKMILIK